MPSLTNDPTRCEVMNLGWAEGGHGPYLIRQEGYAPGGTNFRPQRFLLQKDGRWLLNLAFVMLPEKEQEAQLFRSLKEVAVFLDDLSARPVKAEAGLPAGATMEEIEARFESCAHRILRGMRECAVTPWKAQG